MLFLIGIVIKKFKLFNVEESAQGKLSDAGYNDDKPLFDKSSRKELGNISEIDFD
jgi:hypothetical protein